MPHPHHHMCHLPHPRSSCCAAPRDGGLAITRNQVQGGPKCKFWYINMSSLDCANKALFQHPTSLLSMAIFLRWGGEVCVCVRVYTCVWYG